ncbi:unnamed protein product [Thelazia callipaeda]|uniref:Kinesin-like protein n=1 Tax=Thelazia callipaeda TaxID=103827 RepID=A0A0N5CYY4_THECL|nr:unnamed protein product [Thelazia callipaeda]
MMDIYQIGDLFCKCKCSHEVESRMTGIKENILEAHLEVKNHLIRNLEDIIDEQEARIQNMDDFINGRIKSLSVRNNILKGISLLSLEFGTLSNENLALKEALVHAQRSVRLLQLKLENCSISEGELVKISKDMQEETRNDILIVQKNLVTRIDSFMKSLVKRYQREVDARKRLHNQLVELNGNIRVFCRIRPSIGTCEKSLLIDPYNNSSITVNGINGERRKFSFDRNFDENHSQAEIFEEIIPIIKSCMDGYNVCIFAYGHTGSGKTYTMEGPGDDPGIYKRSLIYLFQLAKERRSDFDYTIFISMLEIYNEKIRDLLSKNKSNLSIKIGDSGALEIPGLLVTKIKTLEEVQEVLERGRHNRACAKTDLNDQSSRSHVIVRIQIKAVNRTTNTISESRLNLVDLAGSERVSQSGATGQQLKEAQCINRSLSELGNVVTALRERQQHIPFRNSQLTRLLEDCLNGDSKTLVVVQLAPEAATIQETVSSLNFANKVSRVQTRKANGKNLQVCYGSLSVSSGNSRYCL